MPPKGISPKRHHSSFTPIIRQDENLCQWVFGPCNLLIMHMQEGRKRGLKIRGIRVERLVMVLLAGGDSHYVYKHVSRKISLINRR